MSVQGILHHAAGETQKGVRPWDAQSPGAEGAGAAPVLWEPQPRLAKPPAPCSQLRTCTVLPVWVIRDISASERPKMPTGTVQGPAGGRAPGRQVRVTRGKARRGAAKRGPQQLGQKGRPRLSAQPPQPCCSPFPLV